MVGHAKTSGNENYCKGVRFVLEVQSLVHQVQSCKRLECILVLVQKCMKTSNAVDTVNVVNYYIL